MASEQEIRAILSRQLDQSDVEWRVQSCGLNGDRPWAIVIPYKTARIDRQRLNEAFGIGGWQSEINTVQFMDGDKQRTGFICRIGGKIGDEWIWKTGCAAQTDIESFKGGESDAFKRAGFAWGIGEELYEMGEEFADCSTDRKPGYTRASGRDKKTKQYFTFYWKLKGASGTPAPQKKPQRGPKISDLEGCVTYIRRHAQVRPDSTDQDRIRCYQEIRSTIGPFYQEASEVDKADIMATMAEAREALRLNEDGEAL